MKIIFGLFLSFIIGLGAIFFCRDSLIPWMLNQYLPLDVDYAVSTFGLSPDNTQLVIGLEQLQLTQDADADAEQPLLSMQLLSLSLELSPLWQKRLNLSAINIDGLSVYVSKADDGKLNWPWKHSETEKYEKEKQAYSGDWSLGLGSLALTDLNFFVTGFRPEKQDRFLIKDFISSVNAQTGKRSVSVTGELNGITLSLVGESSLFDLGIRQHQPILLDFNFSLAELNFSVAGSYDFYGKSGTDLVFHLQSEGMKRLAVGLGMELPPLMAADISARFMVGHSISRLEDIKFQLTSDNQQLLINGSVMDVLGEPQPYLNFDFSSLSFQQLLQWFEVQMAVDFRLSASGFLGREKGLLLVKKAEVGLSFEGFEAAMGHQFQLSTVIQLQKKEKLLWQESFDLPLKLVDSDLSILMLQQKLGSGKKKAAIAEYAFDLLLSDSQLDIDTDGLQLASGVNYKKEAFDLQLMIEDWAALNAKLDNTDLTLRVQGPFIDGGIELNTQLILTANNSLQALTGLQFTPIKQLTSSTKFKVKNQIIGLLDTAVDLQLPQNRIKLGGSLVDVSDMTALNFKLDLQSADTQILARQWDQSADAVQEIAAETDWLRRFSDRQLNAKGGDKTRNSDDHLNKDWAIADKIIRENNFLKGKLNIYAALQLDEHKRHFKQIKMNFDSADLQLALKGHVGEIKNKLDADVSLNVDWQAGIIAGLENPGSLRAEIHSEGNELVAKQFVWESGKSQIEAELRVAKPFSKRPEIKANIVSEYFDLRPIMNYLQQGKSSDVAEVETEPQEKPLADALLLPEINIPLDWLGLINLNVSHDFKTLMLPSLNIKNFNGQVLLKDKRLQLNQINGALLGGHLSLDAALDNSDNKHPHWTLNSELKKMNPADIIRARDSFYEGELDMMIDVSATGSNTRSMLSSLSGRYTAGGSNATLHGAQLDKMVPDFLLLIFKTLNPLYQDEKANATEIECLLLHLEFEEGKMHSIKDLQLRTPESNYIASWVLDLNSEKQTIQVLPRTRKGLGMSTSELVQSFQLSGTLAKPKIEVDPLGLMKSGTENLLLYGTGGWAYIVGWRQIQRLLNSNDACEKRRDLLLLTPLDKLEHAKKGYFER